MLLLVALPGAGTLMAAGPVRADDQGDDNGGDDHGGDDGGDDDSGDDHGGGNDDKNDDSKDDDSKDDDGVDTGTDADDHVEARDAVRDGRILPLRDILGRVKSMRAGRVLSVNLTLGGRTPVYILKVESEAGVVRTLKLNARTGRPLGPFGWW